MNSFREQYWAASYRPRARREGGCLASRFGQLVGLDGWLLLLPQDTEIGTARANGQRRVTKGRFRNCISPSMGTSCTGRSPDEGPASGRRCNPRAYISSSLATASISSGSRGGNRVESAAGAVAVGR